MSSLAVINCKSSKVSGSGPFTGEELYWASPSFRAQVTFIKEFYDDYIILSAGHGIVYPRQRIYQPYNASLWRGTGWTGSNQSGKLSKEQTEDWRGRIIRDSIFDRYENVDFHISWYYGAWLSSKEPLDLIKLAHPSTTIRYVKQPQSLTGPIYLYPKLANQWRAGNMSFDILAMTQDRKPVDDEFVLDWMSKNPKGNLHQFRASTGKSVGDDRFKRLKKNNAQVV